MLFLVSSMVKPAHRVSPLLYPSMGGWVGRVTERRAMTYRSLGRTVNPAGWQHMTFELSLRGYLLTHCHTASSWKPTRWSPGESPLPDWLKTGNQCHHEAAMEWPHGTESHHRPPGESAHISWFRDEHGEKMYWVWNELKKQFHNFRNPLTCFLAFS